MPIRPEHRWLYPIDWRELSRLVRFERAGGRCDHCSRPHRETVLHLGDGRWYDRNDGHWRDGEGRSLRSSQAVAASDVRTTRVVLACAHLNHDPTDNRQRNLAALCQRCHILHDGPEHRRRRWLNAFRLRAWRDLFDPSFAGIRSPGFSDAPT